MLYTCIYKTRYADINLQEEQKILISFYHFKNFLCLFVLLFTCIKDRREYCNAICLSVRPDFVSAQ